MRTYDIKPIETHYRCRKFRSRTEARWAVFFDSLNLHFIYESGAFKVGPRRYYCPDFWLSDLNIWAEVKPTVPTEEEYEKGHLLSTKTGHRVAFLIGAPAVPYDAACPDEDDERHFIVDSEGWDHRYVWCSCPICGKVAFQYGGECAGRLGCACDPRDFRESVVWTPKLMMAYENATNHRFVPELKWPS